MGRDPSNGKTPGWSKPPAGCRSSSCRDCANVNDFLIDPAREVGAFPLGKARRNHLDIYFPDRVGAEYTVFILDRSNPHVWEMTKSPSKQQADFNAFKKREAEAQRTIMDLKRAGPLREYLCDDEMEAITSLDVHMLERLMNQSEARPFKNVAQTSGRLDKKDKEPLREVNGNADSVSRVKRRAPEDSGDEGGSAKRGKIDSTGQGETVKTKHGLVEVIDLT